MESLSFPSETSLILIPSIVMVPSRIGSILLEKRIAVLLLELEWTTITDTFYKCRSKIPKQKTAHNITST